MTIAPFFKRHSLRVFLVSISVCWLWSLAGCSDNVEPQSDQAASQSETKQIALPPASSVPLRVLIVSQVRDQQIVIRQWASVSDQPLRLEAVSEEDFLKRSTTDADVVLFPSHMLGELQSRKWIGKLPVQVGQSLYQAFGSPLSMLPDAWRKQASYNEVTYGVSLGCTSPVVVLEKSLQSKLVDPNVVDWVSISKVLQAESNSRSDTNASSDEQPLTVSDEALVDRFLTIAFSLTARNPRYGILFDVRSMEAQIASESCIQAAKILQQLNQQSPSGMDMLRDDLSLWNRMQNEKDISVAILSPQRLIDQTPAVDQAMSQTEESSVVPMTNAVAWNTGYGLVASITTDCQQSNQATAFLEWLTDQRTRESLAAEIYGSDTSDRYKSTEFAMIYDSSQKQLEAPYVIQEPRLPAAHKYRRSLAAQIRQMLNGAIEPEQALTAVAKSWKEITAAESEDLAREYQRSLDLAK